MNDSGLTKLENFFSQFKLLRYRKGEVIFRAEDDPPGVFYLKQGYVRLYSLSDQGRELTFNIFKPGSYFSMMWALGGSPNGYFFEALTPVEVWRAPKDRLIEFIKKEPEVLFELTRRILVGLNGILAIMQSLLFGNGHTRVASVLLVAAKRFGKHQKTGEVVIQLPLTHQNIASLAGLTRETTSLVLEKMEKDKLITSDHHFLTIKNIKKFEEKLLAAKEDFPSDAL